MTVDQLFIKIIEGAPNVVVAIMALWWASRAIDRFIDFLMKLVDALIVLSQENQRLARALPPSDPVTDQHQT